MTASVFRGNFYIDAFKRGASLSLGSELMCQLKILIIMMSSVLFQN